MKVNKEQKRKKNRLQGFDYSKNAVFFVTICTIDKKNLLSDIMPINVGVGALDDPLVQLKESGIIVQKEIEKMNDIYSDLYISKYVIMPNHIHLMVEINGQSGSSGAPTPTRANESLPKYVSTLKRFTNKKIGKSIWQRSFYDHIIRDEDDYIYHLQYIAENPKKWLLGKDEYYA